MIVCENGQQDSNTAGRLRRQRQHRTRQRQETAI